MRIWEMRKADYDDRFEMRHFDTEKEERAYKEGCRDGWRKAMKEAEHHYNERTIRWGGNPLSPIYYRDRGMYREDYYHDDYDYEERRRRDNRGRYM